MCILDEHLTLVKGEIARLERKVEEFGETGSSPNSIRFDSVYSQKSAFEKLHSFLTRIKREQSQKQNLSKERLGLRVGDTSDLPPELLDELRVADDAEIQIIGVLDELEGIATVDEVMTYLWRKHKTVMTRRSVLAKLSRMAKKEMVFMVPKRKGVYSTAPVDKPAGREKEARPATKKDPLLAMLEDEDDEDPLSAIPENEDPLSADNPISPEEDWDVEAEERSKDSMVEEF